ncbi:hypothetical protein [Bacillus sp. FJAT-22090]|nr:hypothetical protein [Bacillus sp. FJAT-22090]
MLGSLLILKWSYGRSIRVHDYRKEIITIFTYDGAITTEMV